jgi:SAM-dependent methyltransferase
MRFNVADTSEDNLRMGFRYYLAIREAAARHGQPLQATSRVLEFGCGWGRVLRCFLHDVAAENLTGIDVDPEGIGSCRRTFRGPAFMVNQRWPPTKLPSDSFDLIYAVSVFSHLPEALHLAWLAEIRQLLRPGGIFVGTTVGRTWVEARGPAELARYDAGEMIFVPQPEPEYGLAAIPTSYVRREWPTHLDVLEVGAEADLPQVTIVCRRPDSPAS